MQAARDGDPTAARIVELWGERIGIGIANAINTFDPDEVVIGGGGAQAGDLLLEPARRVAVAVGRAVRDAGRCDVTLPVVDRRRFLTVLAAGTAEGTVS